MVGRFYRWVNINEDYFKLNIKKAAFLSRLRISDDASYRHITRFEIEFHGIFH